MPKTPKVPRPPRLDVEHNGLSANEMRSLMHTDDRASGFETKGHIDLRKLDAEPTGPAPRAPSLPTDANEYESPPASRSSRWWALAAVGLVLVAIAAYVFTRPRAAASPAEPAAEPTAAAEPLAAEPTAAAEPIAAAEPTAAEPDVTASNVQESEKVEEKSKGTVQSSASGGSVSRKATSAKDKDRETASEDTETVSTEELARRAAALQGQGSAEQGSSEQGANESVEGAVDEALEDKPTPSRSIDELLDTATGSSGEFDRKTEAATTSETPTKAEVSKVMAGLMPGFRSCAGELTGVANITVAAIASGKVVSARVSGAPFAGTRQGTCMESVVKQRAKFESFEKSRFEFSYPVQINP